jgi:c-di-GMP-binding flagellar brake protein YcgR
MAEAIIDSLHDAIARNSPAVVSFPSAGMLRHCKTRFLAEELDGFWVESSPGDAALVDEVIQHRKPVGMAFKSAQQKVIFTAIVVRREPQYRMNAQTTVEALLLDFPEKIKAVQRRTAYRVCISSSTEIIVRVWRIADHWILRDKPSATTEVQISLRNLSIGGMCMLCPPKDGEPIRLVPDTRLRITLAYGPHECLLEGRVRHIQPTPDKSVRAGVQFKKLEDDLDGRQTLSRLTSIVGELHREEVRRVRLGVA